MSAIGISVVENGKIVHSFFSYVNPETFFDKFNTMLTGIDERTVASAPAFPELWKTIEPMLSSGILVAHNALFDLGVLKKCLTDYGITWKPSADYYCIVEIGHRLLPGMKHKLNILCDHYGIWLNHHQAGSDSRAAAEILIRYGHRCPDRRLYKTLQIRICPECSCGEQGTIKRKYRFLPIQNGPNRRF